HRRNGLALLSASQCGSGNAASARPNDGQGFPPEPGAAAQRAANCPSSSTPAQSSKMRRSNSDNPNIAQSTSSADGDSIAARASPNDCNSGTVSPSPRSSGLSTASSAIRQR